jgi:hypothetical protein
MNSSLTLVLPQRCQKATYKAEVSQRLLLYADELYRVPAEYRRVRAVAGRAHITHAGQDIILEAGREAHLSAAKDVALVSALKCDALVLELSANADDCRRQSAGAADVLVL